MSKVYLISDLHLGHRNILKYRSQFNSIEEHDNIIFDNIMSVASKRNTLWILGDVIFGRGVDDRYYNMLKTISEAYGSLNVIIGNHDTESNKRQSLLLDLWKEGIYSKVYGLVSYKNTWLSHCPIHPEEMRGKSLNIHGHTHNHTIDDDRYVNVCCEQVGYKPVSFQDILRNIE